MGFKILICSCVFFFKSTPSDEDVADAALLRGEPVLVCEERIQVLVQTVVPVSQSVITKKKGVRDMESSF